MQGLLVTLIQCSISMTLITLVYAAIQPLLSKRYAAKWMYGMWLLIAAGWIIPFRPQIDQLNFHVPIPGNSVVQSKLFMDVSDMGNTQATVLLWVLAAVWGCGVVSVVLYHALRHGRFIKRVRRWSEPVIDVKVLGILDRVRSELRITKPIGLSMCESITNPMLVGFFRPVILLPPMKLSDDALSLILRHELIHYKRHDLWYKAMILTATALHWFNPLVYLMAKAAAKQCEISCDALVLQNADHQRRVQYGETIIAVVRNGAKLRTALSTNFYGGKKDLKNRISFIMDQKGKKSGILLFCLALVGILWTGSALTDEANADDPQTSIAIETVTWSYDSDSHMDNEVTRLKESLRRYANNLNSSHK
ncbi:M56 family metallopeptidase [Paenibacillus lautus]